MFNDDAQNTTFLGQNTTQTEKITVNPDGLTPSAEKPNPLQVPTELKPGH